MPTFAKEFENVRAPWHFTGQGSKGREFEMEGVFVECISSCCKIRFNHLPNAVIRQPKELQAAFAAGQLQPKSSVYVKAVNEWHLGWRDSVVDG